MQTSPDCVFCKIVAGEFPSYKVFEDEVTLAIMDIMPLSAGHVLVMPKLHCETIFDMEETLAGWLMTSVWKVAGGIKTSISMAGLSILQSNYSAAGQLIPHVHFHLIPRNPGDQIKLGRWSAPKGNDETLKRLASNLSRTIRSE